jgi:uncharacterized repeat protein (TIGR01451 family)
VHFEIIEFNQKVGLFGAVSLCYILKMDDLTNLNKYSNLFALACQWLRAFGVYYMRATNKLCNIYNIHDMADFEKTPLSFGSFNSHINFQTMFLRHPSYESVKFHGKPQSEEISLFKSLNLKVMKGILQTFVFLLLLMGAESLWGQCSIGAPTVTGVSCQSHSTDSPTDDAVQFNLNVSATAGSTVGYWIDVSGGTTVTPQEGTYGSNLAITLGNGTAGSGQSYTITLTDKADLSCQRTFVVGPTASCSAGCSTPIQFICDTPGNPGTQSVTLTAEAGLTNVLWFNQANVQVGAGQLVVTTTTPGMADGSETFRYEAQDGNGCVVSLCCPITVQTQDCGHLDLALIKQKSDNLPVSYGQTITFNIQVCNQGTDPVTSVSLIDYIPSGFTFSPNNGWTSSGPNAVRTLTPGSGLPVGGLAVSTCVTVPINFVVSNTANPTNVLNYAEITAGTDSKGRTDDIDSTPDTNVGNDAGGVVGTATDDILTGDGIVDEDDHDPATVRIVDLALIKEIITAGPYNYNQPITFRITVTNQGNETASSIVVSDYVPAGFSFVPNNGWAGASPLITRTITGPLAPGASTTVDLVLTLQPSAASNAWLNVAEISSFNDTAGNAIGMFDIDSDPDQSPNNDAGGLVNSPADNYLNGNGTGAPGSGVAATDEDDQDPALVQVFDLALKKELVTAGPYTNGQTLTFNITVYNQGNVDATNVVVTDYIPNGYTFTANNGWTGASPTITNTIASLAAGASTVVPLQLTFITPASGTPPSWVNRAEISSATGGTDVDSTPDGIVGNDNPVNPGDPDDNNVDGNGPSQGEDEDDSDPAGPQIVDIALAKTTVTAGPYSYGQNIVFNVAVTNQGSVALQNVDVTDYIPCGFTYVTGSQPWTLSGSNAVTRIAGPLAAGATVNLTITLRLQPCATANAWLNYAEVSYMENTSGVNVSMADVDSDSDSINGNDAGGLAESPADDYVNGNGTGTPGSGTAATDEDDHDPELVPVFDLALKKVLNTAAPYTYGQTHSFTITVYNQGNVAASNIVLNDYIPAGYTFAANNGWTGAAPTITRTIAGPLAPGASMTVNLDLTFVSLSTPTTTKSWVNYTEVASATDAAGNPVFDVDSTPNSNGTNENAVYPQGPGDNDTASTSDTGVGSQDDHDPAGPKVFDLALRKTKVTATPSFSYGQTVMYQIEVFNQGNIAATNIEVTDYLPCGLEFNGASATNAGWSLSGSKVTKTYSGTLNPGQSTTLFIDLIVRECTTNLNSAWTNYAEISRADDTDPATPGLPTDVDSTPDGTNGNDTGGVPNFGGVTSGTDDTINNENGDEDDHDPVKIEVFDLALRKVLATPAPYTYGQALTFNIEVFNQGNVTAQNIQISDYVPSGYTFAANNGWTGAAPTITRTIAGPLAPGASTGNIPLVLTLVMDGTGADAWDNYAEISASQDNLGNNRNDDADSVADTNPNNDNPVQPGDPDDNNILGGGPNASEDEDDHDPAAPVIVDIALRKTTVTPGPYHYGDVVSFNVEVINQGNVDLTDIDVVDYIPCGFEYVSGSQTWTLNGTQAQTNLAGILVAGASTNIRIDLRVKACATPNAWLNYAEVRNMEDTQGNNLNTSDIDSNPDNTNGNDDGGQADSANDDFVLGNGKATGGAPGDAATATDEDDHDPELIQVFDLALKKTLTTAGPYRYGDNLTFTIDVYNQGNMAASNIVINDYIPAGYTFNGALNPTWSGASPLVTRTIAGPLAAGASTSVTIVLTLVRNSGETAWDNYAEIGGATDTSGNPVSDADSNPDNNPGNDNPVTPGDPNDDNITGGGPSVGQDEDDHDPAAPNIIDVALRKTTITAGPYTYGQVVSFNVDVINQGNVTVTDVSVVDYIPCGFEYVSGSLPWALSGTQATAMLSGSLLPGETRNLRIDLRVKACTSPNAWLNYAEVKSFEDINGVDISSQDIDSTPDNINGNDDGGQADSPNDDYVDGDGRVTGGTPGDAATATDEDDHDPELIPVFDLALKKVLVTSAPYVDGQPVTFNITVYNQGNQTAQRIVVNDYIPIGYTYNAALNPGWAGSPATITYNVPGTLAPGASVVIPLILNIQMTMGGDRNWINYSEIGSADNDANTTNTPPTDADSTPGSNTPQENTVIPGSPDDDNVNGGGPSVGQDEDDHDPAGPRLYDVALKKTTTAVGPFSFGQVVKFDITVYNQGNFPVRNVKVADYIPAGFKYRGAENFGVWTFDAFSGNATTTIPTTLLPGQSTVVSIYLEVQPTTNYVTGWDNRAEIYSFEDTAGNNASTMDIDSSPDTNPNNDAGGEPEGPSDDYVDGDGHGPIGGGPATGDEDDADPERIEIFDLALRKQLVTAGPYSYGDLLEFNITVFNQGNEAATNVRVTDYIPAGYAFNLADNPGWTGAAPNVNYVIAGPILPATSSLVKIYLRVQQTTGGEKHWINYSEITHAEDADGNNRDTWDIDSNPGSNGVAENAVEPGKPGDDYIDGHDKGGEEDDHDPAGIEVFDLAQRKVTANQTGPYSYGNQITYTIELFNQGSISAGNIEVTDYIPCGFKYATANNAAGWTYSVATGTAKRIVAGPLAPGATTSVTIILELQQCLDNSVGTFTNYTEISDSDSNDPSYPPTDIDSNPDTNPGNDPGGEPDGPNDDVVTEDPGLPGNDDEDDHDPERVEVFDLALKKELVTAGPYRYGQVLDFNITVCNQGNVNAANIVVSDYLPAGFGFAFATNPGWAGTVTAPTFTIPGTLVQDQCVVIPMKLTVLQTTGGEKNWINYAEITAATDANGGPRVDADSNPGSNNATENSVEPGDPADNNLASTDKGGEEDDHDPAGIEVYDLAQRKVTTATGPFRYGDIVKFTYEIFNQGSIQASAIQVTDYVPCGFKYVATTNNANGWSYNTTTGDATITLPGALVPGASRTVDIYLQVQPCITGSTNAWTNIGEISGGNSDDPNEPPTDIDSDPDKDPDNDPGGEPDGPNDDVVDEDPNLPGDDDEDDHDPERIEVVDLALRKVMVTAGPYSYGQVIDFDIEVFNQGNVTMTNVEVIDYIPQGFTYDPALNPIWQGTYPEVFTIIAGPLAPEASTKVRLKLKLVQTTGGSKIYTNGAEITAMDDDNGDPRDNDDADSTPDDNPDNDNPVTPGDPNDDVVDESPNDPNSPGDDDEDDSDPAGPKIFDLALRKVQLTALPSFSYGQTVMFGIQLYNQGNIDAKDIVIVDTLPCGLEFLPTSAINIAAGWVYNPATREVRTTYRNVLAAGTSTQLMLDNRVVPCYTTVGKAWTNWAEIESANDNDPNTPNPPVDIDSDPDGNNNNDPGGQPNTPEDDEINGDPNNPNNPGAPQDEDDHDPHQIEVFDLAVRKTVDNRGPYRIGETATFRLKVFNQGNVPARNIVLNDYLRSGFSFNPATNAGWTLTSAPTPAVNGLLNYTIPTLLVPGDSIVVTLKLEIALDANPAVTDWWNYAEIRTAQDTLGNNRHDDADSTPNSNSPYENDVEPDDAWDNVVNGNGPNFNQDEDDHDPEKVIVVGGLGDTVWKDLDGDGIQDPGEPGVANVVATLTDCNGNVLATDVTDANGFYFFDNLIPGNYQVQFNISNLPQGCAFTFQNQGSDDKLDSDVNLNGLGPCTNITGGEYDSTYDAGLLILAAIGDFVWHDLNGDGQQGAGEPGIPGVQVNLYKGDGTYVGTTYTNASGYYLFDFLYPGNYYLEFINPTGYDRTFPNRGNDVSDSDSGDENGPRTTATTYLSPGERDMTWDAGYYKCIPLGDLVWYDINKNDIWDTNENGINGLKVNLWRNHFGTWLIWDDVRTGHKPGTPSDDGYFKFCAPPGQYYIEIELPPLGLVRARPNIGSVEEIDSDITNANGPITTDMMTLLSGQEKCDLGAGFYPQATAGNLVWLDANANGAQEPQEARMADVTVQAISIATGTVTSEAVTDAEGTYLLEGLEKQAYYLKFTPPAGYFATVARAASDDIDSDVDHTYGINTTRAFDMQPANAYENIDMGLAFSPLPVTWLDVRAERVNDTHIISWQVAKEVNVSHYEVERRMESEKAFYTIPGKVMAKGNLAEVMDYNLTDFEVEKSGVYIYRVKQYDFDGKFTYSKLVKVSHNGENSVELYPNPARTESNLQVVLAQDSDVKIEMYDATAKLIKVIKASDVQRAGDVNYNINLQSVPAGVYNVIVTIDGVQIEKKLIRIE